LERGKVFLKEGAKPPLRHPLICLGVFSLYWGDRVRKFKEVKPLWAGGYGMRKNWWKRGREKI